MKRLLLVGTAALILSGCASSPEQQAATGQGGELARNLRIAAAAERSGQFEVAMGIYAAAHQAHPGDTEVAQRLAGLLMQAGAPDRAREVLAEARRRHPADAALLQAEGRALLELGEAEQALALFDAHLRRAPSDARSLNGRGIALDLLSRHAEARMAYRAAREADPRSTAAAGNLALSLLLSGCTDAAAAVLQSAPHSTPLAGWLGNIRGAARSGALRDVVPAHGAACELTAPQASAQPVTPHQVTWEGPAPASDRLSQAAPAWMAMGESASLQRVSHGASAPAGAHSGLAAEAAAASRPVQASQPEPQQAGPASAARAAPGERVVVRQDANVRGGPSRETDVVREAAAGTVLRVFQRSGSWVQVGQASSWGWMHVSLLEAEQPASESALTLSAVAPGR